MSIDVVPARKVVLVVEDDVLQRMGAAAMIEEAGFDVVEAANTDEAIRILESRTDIRLVFTDVDMPGSMDGMKLAAAVRHRWPPIEIIVTSGQVLEKDVQLPSRSVFFAKPYTPQTIVATMRDMLA